MVLYYKSHSEEKLKHCRAYNQKCGNATCIDTWVPPPAPLPSLPPLHHQSQKKIKFNMRSKNVKKEEKKNSSNEMISTLTSSAIFLFFFWSLFSYKNISATGYQKMNQSSKQHNMPLKGINRLSFECP